MTTTGARARRHDRAGDERFVAALAPALTPAARAAGPGRAPGRGRSTNGVLIERR